MFRNESRIDRTGSRKTLRCKIHSGSYEPCQLATFRAEDMKNETINWLFGLCAGYKIQQRVRICQERRIISTFNKHPNLTFEAARRTLLNSISASYQEYKTLKQGSQERARLRKYIDTLLDNLADNPFQVSAPATLPELEPENDGLLRRIHALREAELENMPPDHPIFNRPIQVTPPFAEGASSDHSSSDGGFEMNYTLPERTFSKASLSEIEANAALQPSIPLPVHPDHVGERNKADSLPMYGTDDDIEDLQERLSDALYYDPSDGHESEVGEPVVPSNIVSTGHTVPPSYMLHLHANCWPEELVAPPKRHLVDNDFIFSEDLEQTDDVPLPKVSDSAEDLVEATPSRPVSPEQQDDKPSWKLRRDSLAKEEERKRAEDHRMAASPRAEERGWNASRMHREKEARLAEHKVLKDAAAEAKATGKKFKNPLTVEEASVRAWATMRMLDEQQRIEREERLKDEPEVKVLSVKQQRAKMEKERKAAREKVLAQAHREKAFVPNFGASYIARSVMEEQLAEDLKAANRAQGQNGVPAADALGSKRHSRVTFEVKKDKGKQKEIGGPSQDSRASKKGEKVAQDDDWEDEEDYQEGADEKFEYISDHSKRTPTTNPPSYKESRFFARESSFQNALAASYAVRSNHSNSPAAEETSQKLKFPSYDEPNYEPEDEDEEAGPSTAVQPSRPRTCSAMDEASSYTSEPDPAYEDPTMPIIRTTPIMSVASPMPILQMYTTSEVAVESDDSDDEWNPEWAVDRRAVQYSPGGTRLA